VPPLAAILALDALVCVSLGAVLALGDPSAKVVVRASPGVHAVGAMLLGCAWFTLRLAPRFGIGARRLFARVAGSTVVLLGAFYGAGEALFATLDLRGGWTSIPGAIELVAGAVCALAAAYAWVTSPMIRRGG
jgi:hypothetical protein